MIDKFVRLSPFIISLVLAISLYCLSIYLFIGLHYVPAVAMCFLVWASLLLAAVSFDVMQGRLKL